MKECHIFNKLAGNLILFSLLFLHIYHNYKKFWEELIVYFPLYDKDGIENEKIRGDTQTQGHEAIKVTL
jgi:hypothetical protein